jgi:hypothetical protein
MQQHDWLAAAQRTLSPNTDRMSICPLELECIGLSARAAQDQRAVTCADKWTSQNVQLLCHNMHNRRTVAAA